MLVYGYSQLLRDIKRMEELHPFIEVSSIGRSVLGRDLKVLKFGTGKKSVFINAALHANEWITTPAVVRSVERLAEAYAEGRLCAGIDIRKLSERVTLWVQPMANPDGVELVHNGAAAGGTYASSLLEWNGGSTDFTGWKANVRGVDLNDQFPAFWEEEQSRRSPICPGPRDYVGPAPLSEPEAEAIAAFTREQNFDMVVAFHTQGREIYWNYRDYEPPSAESIAGRLAAASGYEAIKLTGSDAGYKDWFIMEWGRPGFTVEAGYGVNPLPLDQLPRMIEESLGIILQVMLATDESTC